MRRVLVALFAVSVAAAPASADDFGDHRHDTRDFWLKNQPWPATHAGADAAQPRFTKTYMDGVARRFGVGGGHKDFFEQHLGGADGPGLVGTVDGGAPSLQLRWHPGE